MSKLDRSIKAMTVARRRLEGEQTRMKRRNARRALLSAMRSVRMQLDIEYPKIAKPGKPAPIVVKLRVPLFPFTRAWDINAARLFAAIAANVWKKETPKVLAHEGAIRCGSRRYDTVYVAPHWSSREKWRELVEWFGWTEINVDLWRRFWSEPIAVTDLGLAAEHDKFLESRRGLFPGGPESKPTGASHAAQQ